MAKRNYSRKGNKIQPAVQTLSFVTASSSPGSTVTSYIDLSQVASLANRRFYRQGINWAVAGIKVASLKAGTVNVYKLPNTWIMSNAWEKGFRAWQKMNREASEETASVRPRFLDFKIYADSTHHSLGYGANLLPVAAFGAPTVAGEWEPSKLVIPNIPPTGASGTVDGFEIIAVGPNDPGPSASSGLDAKSLIEGYAASRALPNILDPNAPADAADEDENWLMTMFNDGTRQDEEVVADMISENNIAPYPFENDGTNSDTMYPGGANQMSGMQWHDFVQIYSNSGVAGAGIGNQRLKGGNFPCGLIRLDWTTDENAANLVFQIDLVPGNHRGYLCEPMTEM